MGTGNEYLPDPDFDDDCSDDDDEPMKVWSCYGCGKHYGKRPTWGQCEICGCYVEESIL